MRAWLDDEVLCLHPDDVPVFKKGGSTVRNSFFWALRSIAGRSRSGQAWEYETEVWLALSRMLMRFTESGYLGLRETTLEFSTDVPIPEVLRDVSSYI